MAGDLYNVLGVSRDADPDVIKKAFRKLAMKFHPDKNPGSQAEARFKEVNQAYEVLSDPSRRALYDEFGEDSLAQGFDAERARIMRQYGARAARGGGTGCEDAFGGGADLNDLFGDLFNRARGGGGRAQRPTRGQDVLSSITIDFQSSVRGSTVQLTQQGQSEPITVRIPAGADQGSRLRIRGQGAPGQNGGPNGDLLLEINVTPHPHFRREGDDLYLDVPITIGEAYRGDKIRVPTPEGDVQLRIPAKSQGGQMTRLRGKGVARKGKEPGDLYVRFTIQIPTDDDPETQTAIELLDIRTEKNRDAVKF